MPDKIFHSDKLDLNYKIRYDNQNKKVIVFEDNVFYTKNEMERIKPCSDNALRVIHDVKFVFGGVIV